MLNNNDTETHREVPPVLAGLAAEPTSTATATAEEEAEAEAEHGEEEYVVEKVVREGWVGRPNRSKRQYLVKWKGYPHSENTWEPAEHLKDNAAFVAFLAAQ
eukprot:COSAG02_NODE_15393_length_1175_cov_0.910781_2_plen_102_part_00